MKHRTSESRNEFVEKRNLVNTMRRTAKRMLGKLGEELQGDAHGMEIKNTAVQYCTAKLQKR